MAKILLGIGANKNETDFKLIEFKKREFIELFSTTKVGDKDTVCFNPVLPKEITTEDRYKRRNANIKAMTCIVYDLDYLQNASKVLKLLSKKWKFFWLGHTSHSHLTTKSDLGRTIIKSETAKGAKREIVNFFKTHRNFNIKNVKITKISANRVFFTHDPVEKLRIVIPLMIPFPVKSNTDPAWQDAYYAPAKQAGISEQLDDTGSLINRFFYLPAVPEENKNKFLFRQSKHKPYYAPIVRNNNSVEVDMVRDKGFNLAAWLSNQDSYDIEGFMDACGQKYILKDRFNGGKYVQCPHHEQHGKTTPTDTYVQNTDDGFIFHCSHDTCKAPGRNGRVAKVLLDNDIEFTKFKEFGYTETSGNVSDMLASIGAKVGREVTPTRKNKAKKQDYLSPLIEEFTDSYSEKDALNLSYRLGQIETIPPEDLVDVLSVTQYGKKELTHILRSISKSFEEIKGIIEEVFNYRNNNIDNKEIQSLLRTLKESTLSTIEREQRMQRVADYFGKSKSYAQKLLKTFLKADNEEMPDAEYFGVMDETYAIVYNDASVKINLKDNIMIPELGDFMKNNTDYKCRTVQPSFIPNETIKHDMLSTNKLVGYTSNGVPIYDNRFNAWLKTDTSKIIVKDISFNPARNERTYVGQNGYYSYNLWEGYKTPIQPFPVKSKDTLKAIKADNDLNFFFDYIKAHCGDDEKTFNWFFLWIASLIQTPEVRYPTAAIIKGAQGTGKSMMADHFFSKLLYPYYLSLRDVDEITETGGTLAQGRIMIMLDDATFAGSHAQQRKLKNFISSDTVEINQKYIPKYTVPAYARLFLTTNDTHVAFVEVGDRRYLILRASNEWEKKHAQNTEYFNRLVKLGDSVEFLGKLLTIMRQIKPQELNLEWDDLQTAPMTTEKMKQLAISVTPMQEFLRDYILKGFITYDHDPDSAYWDFKEAIPYGWGELEKYAHKYVEARDRNGYNKDTLSDAFETFGLASLLPQFQNGKDKFGKDKRKKVIKRIHSLSLITDMEYHRAMTLKDSYKEQTLGKTGFNKSGAKFGLVSVVK